MPCWKTNGAGASDKLEQLTGGGPTRSAPFRLGASRPAYNQSLQGEPCTAGAAPLPTHHFDDVAHA